MKKKAFTMLELLITVIVIGILATIAIPNFSKMVDKAKEEQAITYLRLIRSGEKIYYAGNSTYIACADAGEIKSNLGVEVTEQNYTFRVEGNPDIVDTFIATATKRNSTETITIDQDGNIAHNP
ncbi:MAG: prepilin-type N-terminal cleavage/methylation domain-containing protein [Candidatus Omnitrophica bacterium]|nr:prepilin-type N-terminal cleavage/methylation domain-containing protein [Candidatus Omnitrophota bacterium]